jgi:hypothetical protein
VLQPHHRPVAVGFEEDLDLCRRFRPVIGFPREQDPGGRLIGHDLGPDAFDTLGRDFEQASTGASLEDDPVHRDAVAVLLVGRPGEDLGRPPSVDVLREESERLLRRSVDTDALADRCEHGFLGRHRCSFRDRPDGRRHPFSARTISSRRARCSSLLTSGCTDPIIASSFPSSP